MRKVLIANRGEIAVRIARACDDAQLASVAVYADIDADALHVSAADVAFSLDGNSPADTYLNIPKLLAVAAQSGADAVHPGYGFLSENADFAQAVLDAGLTWIGPSPDAIRLLGNKITARDAAVRAGAPLVAGSDGPVDTAAEARAFAEQHGLPIAIKAAFGGGGRGMKVVRAIDEVEEAFDSAVREAVAAFGRGECFVERYLDRPRHVEAQVLADAHGNVVVVGTRDCSLQRRHQKLLEEAPAPFLSDEQTTLIYDAAKAVCREAGYSGAGTVEFLVAADGTVAFLEVNTRLQVEHPITEETTGIDLVQEQFRIAAGEPLRLTEDPAPRGHAFEFRLNAEDVGRGFLPSPGTIGEFAGPTGPGIRLDTGVRSGSFVAPQFDSLLAKLIVTGADRQQALRRARRALAEMRITGVATVLPFHRAVLESRGLHLQGRPRHPHPLDRNRLRGQHPCRPRLQHHRPRRRTPHHHGRRGRPAPRRRPSGGLARRLGPRGRSAARGRVFGVRRRCRRGCRPGGAARGHGRDRGQVARRAGSRSLGRGSGGGP
ncbi:acetyl-CoA/propionyl-CoA carboxylase biotin carboxyl carrier protein [Arthrobacter sp. MW3 TE3886]